jgi:hypothetical protein
MKNEEKDIYPAASVMKSDLSSFTLRSTKYVNDVVASAVANIIVLTAYDT